MHWILIIDSSIFIRAVVVNCTRTRTVFGDLAKPPSVFLTLIIV